jgi:exopolyphosphatase/pppGpp-phosphohydrolase
MKVESALTPLPAGVVTVLDIRRDTSLVQRMAGDQMCYCQQFALGADALVRQCLRHEPPLPIELEHAIDLTEEVVMPLAAQFSGSAGLILQGLCAALMINALEGSGISQTVLNLDEVESLFNRLVAVSQGRPVSQETLPTDARFLAVMLILREFMHHLNFSQVTFNI